ncbi:uncharacterized protein LTR77_009850 [Saxophila tyrrhenica]|uniref:Gfd2/YDR514C-like C-terminal domain-containing protein n=1 Tax=Saxophila tyrrhenica TaxID=1690608 RepID=A0AAV9NZ84_9PEZI|nr:hypothetical protein LTR77_009850 [Saxophila tyrrhenica]
MTNVIYRAWPAYRQGLVLEEDDNYEEPLIQAAYNNDFNAFYHAYRARLRRIREEWQETFLADGMACFTAWQAKLTRIMMHRERQAPYLHRGLQCLEDLASALSTGLPPSREYLLVSIDIEGNMTAGINALGISSLDTQQIFNDQERLTVHDENYAFTSYRRHSLFSPTTRITTEMLPQVLYNLLNSHPNIILVGHTLWTTEVCMMGRYGSAIESLPNVIGTVDVGLLLSPVAGLLKLGKLILAHDLPFRPGSLHCAGNDAHYTLQLMLAVMLKKLDHPDGTPKSESRIEAVRELVFRPLPTRRAMESSESDDWEQHMDDNLGLGLFAEHLLSAADGASEAAEDLVMSGSGPQISTIRAISDLLTSWSRTAVRQHAQLGSSYRM